MCSKLNPPDSEECSFCGARLKPLKPPSGDPLNDELAGDKPEDVPDWLRSLRTDETPLQEDAPSEEGEAVDSPDWLERIRNRAQSELGQPSDDAQEETPDWLNSLSGDTTPDQQPAEEDDWMNKLSGWQPGDAQPPVQDSSTGQPSPELEEDFSWLGGLREQDQAASDMAPSEIAAPSDMAGDEMPAEAPDESGFGLTGFLSSLEEKSTGEEAPSRAAQRFEPAASDFSGDPLAGLPEWLGGDPPSEEKSAPEAGEAGSGLPEWLQSLSEEPDSTPTVASSDTSDWLGGKPGSTQQEAPEDLPQWLGGAEPVPASAQAQPSQEDSIPSWLASFAESDAEQGEKAGGIRNAGGIGNAGDEKMDWSDETSGEKPPIQPGADLPAWLSGQEFAEENLPGAEPLESEARSEPSAESKTPVEFQAPDALETPTDQEQVEGEVFPEWFSSFEDASAASLPSAPLFLDEEKARAGASGGDVPDWLRDFDAPTSTGSTVPPLIEPETPLEAESVFEGEQPFAADLPDWLAEDSSQPSGDALEQPAEASADDLAQAELPDWVKEMRPIESIIPGAAQMAETERKTEKSGPLAGMNGVLPAEELAARYSKPPVYTVKLRVTEKQRGQAAQLETILAQETQPLLIPPQGKNVQGLLLRILVALLLIVVLSLPPLMGMGPLATPVLFPVETQRMFDQIQNNLQDDSPVLLAVDFEPGLYGEMRLASLPVLEHLISKNARIIIISTRPNGPALAQNLLAAAAENHEQYNLVDKTENLGYLPGDTISLLAFAGQPSFAAPANLGGELVSQRPTLQGINGIRDFSQVIVLTDTAETGRAWVEQVRPQMGDVPLLMVVSAQAAPMIAPFVQSDQVNGLVSGQLGGVLYAQWAEQESPVYGYLASYQVGILLALVLTLLGGLFSAGVALMKRGQKDGE